MKNELYNDGIYNVTEEWKASHFQFMRSQTIPNLIQVSAKLQSAHYMDSIAAIRLACISR